MRTLAALLLVLSTSATAGAQDLVLEDTVPDDAPRYFAVPFSVPAGTVEIEVRHDDLSDANILDWGLADASGVRGWGGGNTEPAVVGVDAASRSYRPGPIEPGEWSVLVGLAKVSEPPARYRIEIVFRTAATLVADPDRGAYVPAAPLESEARWYAGDFHVHTRESGDARATLDEAAALAAERGLDFIELSEHNTVSQVDLLPAAQTRHPAVLLMPGSEVTTYAGHGNAIGTTAFVDFRVMSPPLAVTLETLTADARRDGLFAINHPALALGDACIGCAWELPTPPAAIDAVEVQNGAYSVTGLLFYRQSLAFWDTLLDEGGHAAAIGGSDDHRAGVDLEGTQSPIGSPTTLVWAEELSVAGILAGVAAGRTVVKLDGPDDPMVELFVNEQPLGSRVIAPEVTLRAVVTGADGGTLLFVRNGETVERVPVDADPFETTLVVPAPAGDVDDRWRVQWNARDPGVVTSHVWVAATGEAPVPDAGPTTTTPDEGCGCRTGGDTGSGALPLLLVFALLRQRKRC